MLLVGTVALAQTDPANTTTAETNATAAITFPITSLGNCDSKEACKLYCDVASHREACFTFAAKVGLMTLEKIKAAKIIIAKKGPGNCDSKDSCRTYCEDSAHTEECLTFAKENKIIGDGAATLIKKFTSGEGPGACKSAETCRMYCEDSSHRGECRTFAEENGLAPKMGSSTPPLKARMSSTSMEVKRIIASTTPGYDRGMELKARATGTTTAPKMNGGMPGKVASSSEMQRREAEMKMRVASTSKSNDLKKPLPPTPPKPTTNNDGLGAIILKGFAKMLGF